MAGMRGERRKHFLTGQNPKPSIISFIEKQNTKGTCNYYLCKFVDNVGAAFKPFAVFS